MSRFMLDVSKQGLYMFFDPTNMMLLRDYEPLGEAIVNTPEIENAVRSGIIIDIDGLTNVEPRSSNSKNHDYILQRFGIKKGGKFSEKVEEEIIEKVDEEIVKEEIIEEEIVEEEDKKDKAKAEKKTKTDKKK